MPRVLLNHVYYSPVGHVVEAIRYARGLHEGNSGSEIHVALGEGAPAELCDACPWIARTYRVRLEGGELGGVSDPPLLREWDYVLDNNLIQLETASPGLLGRPDDYVQELGREEELALAYYARTEREFIVGGRGVLFPEMTLPDGLGYVPDAHIDLEIPQESRAFAKQYEHEGPKIAVLPAGSGHARIYPEAGTWAAVIRALGQRFPAARFYLTGARTTAARHTSTTAYTPEQIAGIVASSDRITDCYDMGLWNQVALLEQCDVLISPHSGFSFLAPCVGTPWLAISGGNWPEYFFNDVPFYSVLPDDPDYPHLGTIEGLEDGPRIPCMEHRRLVRRIPEIVNAAAFLLDPETTYEEAARRHRDNVSHARVRRDRIPLPPTAV
ncbi:MAG TPA: glycosyltransferase family 9 protein [Actinocrinis sp.]